MTAPDTLPIEITNETLQNPHVVSGLAQQAFRLANYDMSPENPVDTALEQGLLMVIDTDEV